MQPKRLLAVLEEAAPALFVLAIAYLAARPLFAGGYPSTDDGLGSHLIRFAAFSQSVAGGNLFPRLDASLNLQYGSNVFTYYAPFAYYLSLVFHALRQDVTGSVLWTFAASIVLGAMGMYALGRELGGRAAGIVAGAAQATLPYLLQDVYIRGALPESLALGLQPWALFAMTRYARTERSRWLVLAMVSVAALTLTHNISAMLFLPFLILWAVIVTLREPKGSPSLVPYRWAVLQRTLAAAALGVGVVEFFWLPALLEQGAVHLERALATGALAEHFTTATLPWSPGIVVSYAHDTPETPIRPGLLQITLALAGTVVLVWSSLRLGTRRSLWILLCFPVALLLLFMQHAGSQFLWLHLPFAAYVQFPYRLFGIFGLITSLLAGFLPLIVRHPAARMSLAVGLALVIAVAGLRQLRPDQGYGVPATLDAREMLLMESATGNLSGAANAEFLPSTVSASPETLVDTVLRARTLPATDQPNGLTATVNQLNETSESITVHADAASTLVLRQFYVPGWTALSNGRTLRVHPVGDLGLLGVDVPAGDEPVHLSLVQSPVELVALLTSFGCVMIFGAWMFSRGSTWSWFNGEGRGYVGVFVLVAAAAVVLLIPRGNEQLSLLPTTPVEIAPGYQLAGIQIDRERMSSRGTLGIVLHLLCQSPGSDLLFEIRAQDANGNVFADSKGRPWNGSTGYWQSGELGVARMDLSLPPDAPTGQFGLSLTAYDARRPNDELTTVTLVQSGLSDLPAHPYHELSANLGGALLLRGYTVDAAEAGQTIQMSASRRLNLTLDTQSLHPIYLNLKLFVHLRSPDGREWPQHDVTLGGDARPTGSWQPGETARQTITLSLPADAPAGEYSMVAGAYDPDTSRRLAALDPTGASAGDSVSFGRIVVGS